VAENPRLDEYVIQDLNANPTLPFGDGVFDGVGCCVSIDYLTQPVEVLREVGRVLRVGAPVVISFSNRCFPDKAVPSGTNSTTRATCASWRSTCGKPEISRTYTA
jgi:ubiquinone/menaquinone biosynthesis C-methylase UbiE